MKYAQGAPPLTFLLKQRKPSILNATRSIFAQPIFGGHQTLNVHLQYLAGISVYNIYLAYLLLSFFSCRNWITIENISLQLQSALSWPNSPNFYPTFLNCLICFSSYAGKVLFTVTVKWAVWRLFIDCHNTTWLANIVILSAIQHKLT